MRRTLRGLVVLLICLGLAGMGSMSRAEGYDQVLRLHVIANSDSTEDQALKLKVKDAVVALMREQLSNSRDFEEAKMQTRRCLPLIEKTAETQIRNRGYDYPVKVLMGEYEFPTRFYGDLVFPQGRYEAVRVIIGRGQGRNWWCVLFPPLCLVSSSDRGLTLNSNCQVEVKLKLRELWDQGLRLTSNHRPASE